MPKGGPHVSSNIVWQLPGRRARTFQPKEFQWAKIMMRIYQSKVTAVKIPTGLLKNKKGAAKAPCGSHRSYLTAKAAWLFPTIDAARLVLIRQKISSAF
jgi:hypothetical protein